MLTLWYLVLGWKEYNKPFRKPAQPGQQPVDPVKKPDLIPLKKDDKTTDVKKPEPPKSIPIDPKPPTVPPRGSDSFFLHNRNQDAPKAPEDFKPTLPSPKIPESPKVPELPKVIPPKTPETPKVPELPKVSPNVPKTPETPKMPELPKTTPKTPETPKMPEPPKFTPPKTPESPKVGPGFPKTPESPKMPELPKTPDNLPPTALPSRRPESVLPDFPPSRNVPSEFPMPPYLPGAPNPQKPTSRDDELFAMGNNTGNVNPNKPLAHLRDLSYAKGEIPDEAIENGAAFARKVQENVSRIPKYMEQSIVSDPYSSSEEEEEED